MAFVGKVWNVWGGAFVDRNGHVWGAMALVDSLSNVWGAIAFVGRVWNVWGAVHS